MEERTTKRAFATSALCVLIISIVGAACNPDGEPTTTRRRRRGPAAGRGGTPAETTPAVPQAPVYRDEQFTESMRTRDPFRSFAATFVPAVTHRATRVVIAPNTGIGDFRLIAVVGGIANPRAMLVDSQGMGFAVGRGDFIGRAEVVNAGGPEAMPVTLNWRVERIRDSGPEVGIVLTREDPTDPNGVPLMRVIPLHPEGVPRPEELLANPTRSS